MKTVKDNEMHKNILVLKIILVVVFAVLVVKFLIVSVYYKEGFSAMATYQTKLVINNPMPRGEIFDRNGKLIVGNKEKKNLIYLNSKKMSSEQEWKIAQDLAEHIDTKDLGKNYAKADYQDLIIRENYSEIYGRLTKKEVEETDEAKINEDLRNKVKQSDYDELKKTYGEEAIKIKIAMDSSSTKNPQILAKDLNLEEQYYIEQNFSHLGGSFIINDWERIYPYGSTLSSFIGSVGPIEEEDINQYVSKGYSQDEKVGTSYVEKELESILHPQFQKIELFFDDEGNITKYQVISSGKAGYDVKLTIDMELQKRVQKALTYDLKQDKYKYLHNAYASIIEPSTGEILALGGVYEKDNKYYDNAIGQFTTAYEVGSIVKPAVLGMGYTYNTWSWDKYIIDKPIDVGGGTIKGSFHNYGRINEFSAIGLSSNVYFYDMLLALAGINYNDPSTYPIEVDQKYFDLVRQNFERYGLGTKTGIGFNEISGVKSSDRGVGLYMDLANGQYDTYTPLQMTQYMATLANGKNRMKANYLLSINEPGEQGKVGKIKEEVKHEILNQVNVSEKNMKHIQKTLLEPAKNGTTVAAADPRYQFASKSGTSESFYYEEGMKSSVKTDNASFLAYGPVDNPKFALSVLLPYWTPDGEVSKRSATNIGADILDACYDLGYFDE